jgi:preprotein translocase subunit SecY
MSDQGKGMSDLWKRLRFVFVAILVYRIGTHIPIPGIDPDRLAALFDQNQGTIIEMFNLFSGGALERMSIFALNVVPYISSAIIMQLFSNSIPYLQELKKDGQAGRNTITQYTRYGTAVLAFIQASALAATLSATEDFTTVSGAAFFVPAVFSIVAGTMFLMWLGEQVSERGIGNGISIIIATSILTGIPGAIGQAFDLAFNQQLSILLLLAIGLLSMVIIAVVVYVERGQRRITVNYAQRQQGRKLMQAQTSHLPFKVNMAGVIPAIFASTFLLFPASISTWFGESSGFLQSFSLALGPGQPLYIIVFAGLIISFCFIWLALTFDTKDVSDNLKRSGAYIAGIRPGEQTANYIDSVLARLTVFGAIYLTLICLLPLALINAGGISPTIAVGGTSVLIIVVVLMDFMAQVQSHMMSSQYASLMKKANLKNYKR